MLAAMATATLAHCEATFFDSAVQRRAWKVVEAKKNAALVMDDLAGSSVVLKEMVHMKDLFQCTENSLGQARQT